ncbi:hypothetical protein [Pseudoroseomonas ludipueritiae]|uniref:Uncharacterized protein n=1 Tax=Pseudoroseomonas ludipueritiae TaxID=198093 RepID=A0ABR7R4F0_9PROT|nr:hypothetical protein [Pseudoroseomonas ludipueritiae]MBC9176613.1 hypothetical protein [Pseudoroseomonas ludipueritiae]
MVFYDPRAESLLLLYAEGEQNISVEVPMLLSADVTKAGKADILDEHSSLDATMVLLSRPARIHHIMRQSSEDDGGLLDEVEASAEDRVLVVGGTTADLLCASVRRGCRSAMGVAKAPAHPEAAEVVVAPQVCSLEQAEEIAFCARKALLRGAHDGRLAMRLLGTGTARLARSLVTRLNALGYTRLRLRRTKGDALVVTGRFAAAIPSS